MRPGPPRRDAGFHLPNARAGEPYRASLQPALAPAATPGPAADRWVPLGPLLAQVEADARALSAGRHVLTVSGGAGVQLAGSHSEQQAFSLTATCQ